MGAVVACLTLMTRSASAEDEREEEIIGESIAIPPAPKPAVPKPPAPQPPPPMESYAWQTLVADGASLGLGTTFLVSAASSELRDTASTNYALAGGAFGSYVFASPLIHAFHGRWEAAAGSLALRVLGVPLFAAGGAVLGTVICPGGGNRDWGCLTPAVYGFGAGLVVGVVSVSTVDAMFLAKEPMKLDTPKADRPVAKAPKPYKPSIQFVPSVDPFTKTASVGLGGTW